MRYARYIPDIYQIYTRYIRYLSTFFYFSDKFRFPTFFYFSNFSSEDDSTWSYMVHPLDYSPFLERTDPPSTGFQSVWSVHSPVAAVSKFLRMIADFGGHSHRSRPT